MAKIYVGPPPGTSGGGGGGGSVNPTSGVMPVNIFGTFQDSLIQSGVSTSNGTAIILNDIIKQVQINAGNSNIFLDGGTDTLTLTGANDAILAAGTSTVSIDGNTNNINIAASNEINLNSPVFINNHLGLALLRFLSNGASHAAIKVSGNRLTIRNGNDSQNNDLEARQIVATSTIEAQSTASATEFIITGKSKLQSPTDGLFTFINNAGTGFTRLNFGPSTAAFPALVRDGNGFDVMAGDMSNFSNLDANDVVARNNVISFNSFVFGGTSPRGSINAPIDSVITLLNAAGTDFKFLRFGGNTAAFPMLSKQSNGLHVKTADDTAFTNIQALDVTATGRVNTAADFNVTSRSTLSSLADSNFTLYNQAKTAFNLLQFGGITSSFPALKRNTTVLQVRLADDTAFANIHAAILVTEAPITSTNTSMGFRCNNTATNIMLLHVTSGLNINLAGASQNVASAILQADSTTKGFLPPRMTDAQRLAIATPAVGLIVYQTNTNGPSLEGLYINKSTGWTFIV